MRNSLAGLILLTLLGGNALSQPQGPAPKSQIIELELQRTGVSRASKDRNYESKEAAVNMQEPHPAEAAKDIDKPQEEPHEPSESWVLWGHALKITDTLLVAFTFLLFLATVGLFWATRDLVKGADSNAEKQLRAYVFVKDGGVTITPDGIGFVFRVVYKNFGQTPAFQYSTWHGGGIYPVDDLPFPKEPKLLSERVNRSIVGPTAETPVIADSVALSPADLQDIRNRTKAIFIWGGVDYVDAFDKPRHLIVKMRMTGPESQLEPGVRGWPLTPHPLGYQAN